MPAFTLTPEDREQFHAAFAGLAGEAEHRTVGCAPKFCHWARRLAEENGDGRRPLALSHYL